jgi:hypothetical protein
MCDRGIAPFKNDSLDEVKDDYHPYITQALEIAFFFRAQKDLD